jgi:predicted Rossmann fold nucleotide-binding protein DprA/Smf involved in DNA uptake|tara:strand:- start:143 stop:544 length:402 start_codon:yes stop_codon:yes gene_type:complete
MKIGIIGSRNYENKRKIKQTIFQLKNKFGKDLVIFSGGCPDGADKYAKKYALELDCKYIEVNPSHTVKNLYSYMREDWYGKKYSPKNFYVRNKILAKSIDRLIAFVEDGDAAKGTANTVNYAVEFNKKVIVIT